MNGNLNLYEEELSNVNKNIDNALTGNEQYLGKNVRSNINGEVYHISDKGAMKYFQSLDILSSSLGKNGCPADYINIDQDLKSKSFQQENPTFFLGTPMVNTGENQGQSCGAGINVFADQLPTMETTSAGCFTSDAGSFIGNEKTFDQCKIMAAVEGYPMFSLNTSELDNGKMYYGNNGTVSGDVYCEGGWGNENYDIKKNMDCLYGIDSRGNRISCSTGGVMMENNGFYCVPKNNVTKQSDTGSCYGFTTTKGSKYHSESPYSFKIIEMPTTSCTDISRNLDKNKMDVKELIVASGIVALVSNTKNANNLLTWIDFDTLHKCASGMGGGVNYQTLTATYGGNCSQCNISPGNYTSTIQKLLVPDPSDIAMIENTKNPTFYVGKEWTEYYGVDDPNNKTGPSYDPCPDCSKDFLLNYQCGNSDVVTINVPNAQGAAVNLDCQASYTSCVCGFGISDDGDVKILGDIYGEPKELFTIIEPYKGKLVSVPQLLEYAPWEAIKSKCALDYMFNGKKYNLFLSPGTIEVNQLIPSPKATCFFQVTGGMPIICYYIKELTCNSVNGNFTGVQSTVDSTMIDVDAEWCINTRNTYGITPYQTWGTLDDQELRDKWGNLNCNVLSNAPQPTTTPSLFAINQFTNPMFIGNYGKQGYVDDEMVLHEYSKELMPTFNEIPESTIVDGSLLKVFDYTTDAQCKVECIKNSCNYVSINPTTCSLYSDHNGISSSDNGKVFEKVKPAESTSRSCPFQDMQSISTSTWEHYVKSETQMTPQTSCYTEHNNFLNEEVDRSVGLYSSINSELVNQSEETNNYIKNNRKNVNSIISDVENINLMQETINNLEGFANLPSKLETTTTNLYNQTLELKTYNTNQMLLWTFITIILISMNYLIFSQDNSQINTIWLVVIIILLIIGGIIPLFSQL